MTADHPNYSLSGRRPLTAAFIAGNCADREHRYREWFGWRPSTAQRCARVAAGKRCLADSYDLGNRTERCICQVYREVLDNPAIWRDPRGGSVYSADPYTPVDGEALAAFIADAAALGLQVDVSARSGCYPGRTVLIEVYDAAHKPFRKRRRP